MATKRVSATIPEETLELLDSVCRKMKISRSSFLSALLDDTLSALKPVFDTIPDNVDSLDNSEVNKRFRGASADIIAEQVRMLISDEQADIFR